jgi:hypothetical protein
MKLDSRAIFAALAVTLSAPPAYANWEFFGDRIAFSGFGSIGAVRTDTNEGKFRRDDESSGAGEDLNFKVDTNLGLQLTAHASDWLSGTVQSLTMQRTTGSLTTELEWAFLKLQPISGLSALAGRMALPTFLVSDSRNVGYANTWLRPPNEVYGLAMLHRLDGANVRYALPINGTTLTASAIAGKSSLHLFGGELDVDRVKGGNLQWEMDWLTLRVGRVQGRVVSPNDIYVFSGVGASYDRNKVIVQSEFVTRRSKRGFGSVIDADGWYTLAGYRIDQFVPYASYASTRPKAGGGSHLTETQSTIAAGLRWDVFRKADIKFQIERVDTHGTSGISFVTPSLSSAAPPPPTTGPGGPPAGAPAGFAPITQPVIALSLAMDVVF